MPEKRNGLFTVKEIAQITGGKYNSISEHLRRKKVKVSSYRKSEFGKKQNLYHISDLPEALAKKIMDNFQNVESSQGFEVVQDGEIKIHQYSIQPEPENNEPETQTGAADDGETSGEIDYTFTPPSEPPDRTGEVLTDGLVAALAELFGFYGVRNILINNYGLKPWKVA